MTHDPLCPFFYDHTGRELVRQTGNPCTYCKLIANVREDERAAALDAAREAVERVSSLLQPLGPALAAIDALREEQK